MRESGAREKEKGEKSGEARLFKDKNGGQRVSLTSLSLSLLPIFFPPKYPTHKNKKQHQPRAQGLPGPPAQAPRHRRPARIPLDWRRRGEDGQPTCEDDRPG